MSEQSGQDRGFIADLIHNNLDTVRDVITQEVQDSDFVRNVVSNAIRSNKDAVKDVIVEEIKSGEFISSVLRSHPDLVRGVVIDLLAGRVKDTFTDQQQREMFRTRWLQPLIAVLSDMDKELAE